MKENNNKQLSLSQRNRIEEMLNQRKRKFEIANELDKTQSTIAREINRHKILKPHNSYNNDNNYNCKYFVNCKVCTGNGLFRIQNKKSQYSNNRNGYSI